MWTGTLRADTLALMEAPNDDFRPIRGIMSVERNLLGVPTFALHARSARAMDELVYEWFKGDEKAVFIFSRHRDSAFPLPIHTVYLDVLLALFAHNYRDDGYLRFRFSDLLHAAGKNTRLSGDTLNAAKEAIRRYYLCTAEWRYSWKGKEQGWRGPIITSEDVWKLTRDGQVMRRNPRRSKNPDDWHRIQFHPFVVQSIKEGFQRDFLSEVLREGLSPTAFCVYRYFYGFSDRTPVSRSLQQLSTAFPWRGRRDRFPKWLREQLEELKQQGYVEGFEIQEAHARVKCRSIQELRGRPRDIPLFGD